MLLNETPDGAAGRGVEGGGGTDSNSIMGVKFVTEGSSQRRSDEENMNSAAGKEGDAVTGAGGGGQADYGIPAGDTIPQVTMIIR